MARLQRGWGVVRLGVVPSGGGGTAVPRRPHPAGHPVRRAVRHATTGGSAVAAADVLAPSRGPAGRVGPRSGGPLGPPPVPERGGRGASGRHIPGTPPS